MLFFNLYDVESTASSTGSRNLIDKITGSGQQDQNHDPAEDSDFIDEWCDRETIEYDSSLQAAGNIAKRKKSRLKSKSKASKTVKRRKTTKIIDGSSMKEETDKTSIIISIDFGSTHSGCSFSTNQYSTGNQISTIDDYPGDLASGGRVVKVPSRIAYAAENRSWGPDKQRLEEDVIGYEVKPGMKSYHCTKLLLDDKASVTDHDDNLLQTEIGASFLQLPRGRSAEDVIAHYLRHFRELVMQRLNQEFSEDFMNTVAIRYLVTTPAQWDDVAIDRTLRAVKKAGFTRQRTTINTVSEPIAGALAALVGMKQRAPRVLDDIKTCIVIDGGGGTIDLELLGIEQNPQLHVKELKVGEGAKCGSTTIDREFVSLMQLKYGQLFQAIDETERGFGSMFMANFERTKKSFQGDPNSSFRISLPALRHHIEIGATGVADYDMRNGEVMLTGNELATLFAKPVKEICRLGDKLLDSLEQEQIQTPDAIIFVGGLASSKHIWNEVSKHFRGKYGSGVKVLRPDNPWGAVSYGAVVYGLAKEVKVSRVARRHYGIPLARKFREGYDDPDRYFICPLHQKRTRDEICWMIKKSAELKENKGQALQPIKGYLAITDTNPRELQFHWKIYCCDEDKAPTYLDDPGVRVFAELHIDLTEWVAKHKDSEAIRNISQGTPYELKLNLNFKGGESAGNVMVSAVVERKEVGRYALNYTHE